MSRVLTIICLLLAMPANCSCLIGVDMLDSQQTSRVEIMDDYNPLQNVPPAPDDNMKAVKIYKNKAPKIIQNDYHPEEKIIQLNKPEEKKPDHLVVYTSKLVLYGVYRLANHTVRISLGCLSNHFFNQAASMAAGRAFYIITLSATGNPLIANFMYAFGAQTCSPIVSSLVFYAGSHSIDVVYYGGKIIYKTVHVTCNSAKVTFHAGQSLAEAVKALLAKDDARNELIELVQTNTPRVEEIKEQ